MEGWGGGGVEGRRGGGVEVRRGEEAPENTKQQWENQRSRWFFHCCFGAPADAASFSHCCCGAPAAATQAPRRGPALPAPGRPATMGANEGRGIYPGVFPKGLKSLGDTTENQKTLERYWQRWEIELSGQNRDADIGGARGGPVFFNFHFLFVFPNDEIIGWYR